jgi:hypothetical protein
VSSRGGAKTHALLAKREEKGASKDKGTASKSKDPFQENRCDASKYLENI